MKRVFIDCTEEYYFGGNTGIQRVVRNLANNAGFVRNAELIPVAWCGNRFIRVQKIQTKKERIRKMLWWLRRTLGWGKMSDANAEKKVDPDKKIIFVQKVLNMIKKVLMNLYFMRSYLKPTVQFNSGDIFIFGFVGGADIHKIVPYLVAKKVKIGQIIYDLLPMRFPHFFPKAQMGFFENKFQELYKKSDLYIAISQTVADDVVSYAHEKNLPKLPGTYFYLGKDIDVTSNEGVRDGMKNVLMEKKPFIIVSTIEPRKNHTYVLSEFEELWKQGLNEALCIIGKVGWKTDDIVARIKKHPELGKRLILFNDLNDSELVCAYEYAKGVITASVDEGFNLPIVEALSKRKPVFASDIAINREIGGSFPIYFELKPGRLAQTITNFENGNIKPVISNFTWISWKESTLQFADRIIKLKI